MSDGSLQGDQALRGEARGGSGQRGSLATPDCCLLSLHQIFNTVGITLWTTAKGTSRIGGVYVEIIMVCMRGFVTSSRECSLSPLSFHHLHLSSVLSAPPSLRCPAPPPTSPSPLKASPSPREGPHSSTGPSHSTTLTNPVINLNTSAHGGRSVRSRATAPGCQGSPSGAPRPSPWGPSGLPLGQLEVSSCVLSQAGSPVVTALPAQVP